MHFFALEEMVAEDSWARRFDIFVDLLPLNELGLVKLIPYLFAVQEGVWLFKKTYSSVNCVSSDLLIHSENDKIFLPNQPSFAIINIRSSCRHKFSAHLVLEKSRGHLLFQDLPFQELKSIFPAVKFFCDEIE